MPHDCVSAPGGGGAATARGSAGAGSGELKLIRSRIVGLPLQVSTFARAHTVAELLGLEDVPYRAQLDESGSLSQQGVDELTNALVDGLETDTAAQMQVVVNAAVERLEGLHAAAGNGDALEEVSGAVGAVGGLVPLALVGQPVGNALWRWLVDQEYTGDPPAPRPSVGARLVHDLEVLTAWVRERGLTGAEVAERWPDVEAEIAHRVRSFAEEHVGYGPLAWEAPGYDDPAQVAAALGLTTGEIPPLAAQPADPPAGDDLTGAVLGLLTAWLRMTEYGIWLVRTVFHRAIVPRLPELGAGLGISPADVLFLELPELGIGARANVIAARRETYATDAEYHRKNGTSPDRPAELFATFQGAGP